MAPFLASFVRETSPLLFLFLQIKCPKVDGKMTFIGGKVMPWMGEIVEVTSPIVDASTGRKAVIGELAQMGEKEALMALEAAKAAWDQGQGVWPQYV